MHTKNQVNLALERAHAAAVILEGFATRAQLTEQDRETLTSLAIRLKSALDQASAALAIARHTALQAIETL